MEGGQEGSVACGATFFEEKMPPNVAHEKKNGKLARTREYSAIINKLKEQVANKRAAGTALGERETCFRGGRGQGGETHDDGKPGNKLENGEPSVTGLSTLTACWLCLVSVSHVTCTTLPALLMY